MNYWVFDLDGTLVDSFPFYLDMVRELFAEHSLELKPEHFSECLGQPAAKFFESKLGTKNVAQAMTRLRELDNAMKIKVFSGVLDVIKELKGDGRKVAIWTSRDLASARQVLEHNNLTAHIDYCVSGCCVTQHKPHPEGLFRIAEHFGCETRELVVVGDHEYDVKAAHSVSAHPIRAGWHGFNAPESCEFSRKIFHQVGDFICWIRSTKTEVNFSL